MQVFWKIIATVGGAGFIPVAPGTAGALVASAIAFLLQWANPSYNAYNLILVVLIIMGFFLGVMATNRLEQLWGKDPGKVVIDEAVGQWITYLMVPFGWTEILLGLFLFRVFDISKPFFIKRLEKIPGGVGVMLDDVAAGIMANIILQLILIFI